MKAIGVYIGEEGEKKGWFSLDGGGCKTSFCFVLFWGVSLLLWLLGGMELGGWSAGWVFLPLVVGINAIYTVGSFFFVDLLLPLLLVLVNFTLGRRAVKSLQAFVVRRRETAKEKMRLDRFDDGIFFLPLFCSLSLLSFFFFAWVGRR